MGWRQVCCSGHATTGSREDGLESMSEAQRRAVFEKVWHGEQKFMVRNKISAAPTRSRARRREREDKSRSSSRQLSSCSNSWAPATPVVFTEPPGAADELPGRHVIESGDAGWRRWVFQESIRAVSTARPASAPRRHPSHDRRTREFRAARMTRPSVGSGST